MACSQADASCRSSGYSQTVITETNKTRQSRGADGRGDGVQGRQQALPHLHVLKHKHGLIAQRTRPIELDDIAIIADRLQHIDFLQPNGVYVSMGYMCMTTCNLVSQLNDMTMHNGGAGSPCGGLSLPGLCCR